MSDEPASTGDTPEGTTEAAEVEALTDSIDRLAVEVRDVRLDMKAERHRYNQRFVRLCAVVGIGLVAIFAVGIREADIRRISNERARDLAESRVASCKQYNVQQQRAREASVQIATSAVITGLTQLAEDPAHLTPAEEQVKRRVVAEVTAASTATAKAQYPFRDCSTAGIRRFLENPPPDPGGK